MLFAPPRFTLTKFMPTKKSITSQSPSADKAIEARQQLFKLFRDRPLSDEELLANMGLYIRSGALAKILFLAEIYQKVLEIPGVIMEFGVWRGQSLAVFENCRAIFEPYNHSRRIYGFDTFSGYPDIGENDKASEIIEKGVYSVEWNYEGYLDAVLNYHEQENVMSHIRKHALIKGDASITCPQFLADHPEALIALAYFDMALYQPTRDCLRAILPRLVKGSVIVFDELSHPEYPGETKAFLEVIGARQFQLNRSRFLPDRVFLTIS